MIGSKMITAGDDGNILVWDFEKPEELLPHHFYYSSELESPKLSVQKEHKKNKENCFLF